MNPLLKALGYLATGGTSKQAAQKLTRRSIAGEDKIRNVKAKAEPTVPASVQTMEGSYSSFPNPYEIRYGVTPQLPQATRQSNYDNKFLQELAMREELLKPMFRNTRNTGLGAGVAAGAIPPSLLALYLLSQQDNEE